MANAQPTLAADYSFDHPNVRTLKAVGYKGVGRYVSPDPGKNLTVAEATALRAAGLFIWLVWESTANRAGAGHAAGHADAVEANKLADALGYPKDAVLFYAVDFDATPGQVQPYFEGAKSANLRPVGLYGGIGLTGIQLTSYNWQTAAWSNGNVDGHANLYQRVKPTASGAPAGIDEDVLLNIFPAWGLVEHKTRTFPRIVESLKSNAKHAHDLGRIKASAAKVAVRVALAALKLERKRLEKIVKKG